MSYKLISSKDLDFLAMEQHSEVFSNIVYNLLPEYQYRNTVLHVCARLRLFAMVTSGLLT